MKNVCLMIGAVFAALTALGGCTPGVVSAKYNENEIRFSPREMTIEVVRKGQTVVEKSKIGLKVDDACLCKDAKLVGVTTKAVAGTVSTPVYKKASVDLAAQETFADFGDWGVRLVARPDGVAYRFETKKPGTITVDGEKFDLTLPGRAADCWYTVSHEFGCEEVKPRKDKAGAIVLKEKEFIYLPFVYTVNGQTVAVTDSDVHDYPVLNLEPETDADDQNASFEAEFAGWPKKTQRVGGWGNEVLAQGGRWVKVVEHEDWLVKTAGTRTFPWRVFMLADDPSKLCEADIVYALATPAAPGSDFSWVKPGKVAWDWWNCFDNQGDTGCNTKTYERFIDFAAKTGVEYVIFDEGWSEALNIWKFHKDVDVPHLIQYAEKKGVGIILWMAWAQVYGQEEKVAEHFGKLGAKGFKVDFMDRADAEIADFLEKFAAACAKNKLVIDYHGVYRPVGLSRTYPNILNYEGIHGLEQLKWSKEDGMMESDVRSYFLRLSAGPMDYTPGAMLNHAVGTGYDGKKAGNFPGSVGTRARQMAMMALYEAPLQMLCDSPTNYEKNMECFAFMAAVPVVWADTVGLAGSPDTVAACARQAKDGAWYAAGIGVSTAQDYVLDTSFLGKGKWKAEFFRDAENADKDATGYIHGEKTVTAGEKIPVHLAPGGGFIVKFTPAAAAAK